MIVPLYGFFQGDSIGLLILAKADDRVRQLGDKLSRSAAVRVAPHDNLQVFHKGRILSGELTIAEAGIEALDRVDVRWEGLDQ